MTPSVRTFVSVENLVQATFANLVSGIHLVGGATVTLSDLAERIMTLVGQRVSIELTEPPSPDSCGVVSTGKATLTHSRTFDEELERFVESLSRDSAPAFDPPMKVVTPPRAEHPDLVASRQQEAMWSGRVKYGNRWTKQLEERLREDLQLGPDRQIVATCSGTAALRLGVQAVVGRAAPRDVAVLPSFTFAATGEVLVQMGYRLRFCDVDSATWTMDPEALAAILEAEPRVKIVIPVDTLGNPAAYDELQTICDRYQAAMVVDSAPSLGSRYKGTPVGSQASAHAFSMSFAKVISAAGAGGAVIVPAGANLEAQGNWLRSSLMGELNAIAALDQLKVLEALVERRQAIARVYRDRCGRHPSLRWQEVRSGDRHSLVHWVVQIPPQLGRERIASALARVGVETKPYYAPALHEVLESGAGETITLPVTKALAKTALALPMSSEMTPSHAEAIGEALEAAIDRTTKDARSSPAFSSV
jgi:dTDP-4-amino-4,6-dideoxygalactose transaminase